MQQTGTIGIVGGGQLGQMLTEAALLLGYKVTVLDPNPNSPAAQAGAKQIVKDYDEAAIIELASQIDYLTTEFEEGIDPGVLKKLAAKGIKVNPAPDTIATILDKLDQKDYLSKAGIAMGPYEIISGNQDAYKLLDLYGGKLLIKTRRGGYDGYGNRVVKSREEADQALKDFEGKPVYAEAFVNFKKELAVMVVRSLNDGLVAYPVVETIQKDNICHEVIAPASIGPETEKKATQLAKTVAKQFSGAGAFGVEMFLTQEGQILLNEVAPRVHNSGHYTIEACETSQFEQHIRAISGMPLGKTAMKVPAAVMVNILGARNGPVHITGLGEALKEPHTAVHIYGKSPVKIGRKMGHITSIGQTTAEARQRAELARKKISI
jgi:phosphoribosylaminoimidazole carboxylase PurK protein